MMDIFKIVKCKSLEGIKLYFTSHSMDNRYSLYTFTTNDNRIFQYNAINGNWREILLVEAS